MRQVAKLIGGAGTGKTTELLRVLDRVLDEIHDPLTVGYVSFTRAARAEAAGRAADKYNLPPKHLQQAGWFRTLHSVCYKCLGVGKELLTDSAESRTWLQDALQAELQSPCFSDPDSPDIFAEAHDDVSRALSLWHTARSRLSGLETVWAEVDAVDDRTPSYDVCVAIVERYEQAKRLDHRVDFVDLLARYAGWFLHVDGARRHEPEGDVPPLPVWFFDEQQDTSALLDSVCHRLVDTHSCRWVYLAGDPFQAIYNWAGADQRLFLNWPADKTRVMPQSWRCAAPVLAFGERILSECSDYWDRKIQPAAHAGTVEDAELDDVTALVSPAEDWLLLARTNYHAARIGRMLSEASIPWRPTRGRGGWDAPVRNEACKALLALEMGAPISGDQWQSVLKEIPSTSGGCQLLERGTKKRFADMEPDEAQESYPWVLPSQWRELGITEALDKLLRNREWRGLVKGADDYAAAVERWGEEVVCEPRIRVGTIHSVKGAEAENVAVLSSITKPTYEAAQTQEGFNAEQRVWYVGTTRASRRLVILDEKKTRYRKRLR